MQYNDLTENVMFVRWTVHDFIIGLLWLCVCVCLHTLSQGTVYTCRDPHPSHPISLHHTFLYRFFFCLVLSCHLSFLFVFSRLVTSLFLSYFVFIFYFSCYHFISSHLVLSLISSCHISSYLFSYCLISFVLFLFCIISSCVLIFLLLLSSLLIASLILD